VAGKGHKTLNEVFVNKMKRATGNPEYIYTTRKLLSTEWLHR